MPQTQLMRESLIVGGGPAGAAAAIALARAGKPVCLLERKPGPHHKVCGEHISWDAARTLADLGLDLPALGARAVQQVSLYSGDDQINAHLPFPAWSLSRYRLDEALLQLAADAGAQVCRGLAVRSLLRTDKGWKLHVKGSTIPYHSALTTGEGDPDTLHAKTVFLATGKHDLPRWQRPSPRGHSEDLLGLKIHLRLAPAQQQGLQGRLEMYLFDGGYAGLEMIEEDQTTLCFLVSKHLYHVCERQWPKLLQQLCTTSSQLQQRLAGAQTLWSQPLAIYRVPFGYLHMPAAPEPGLFRLGDQAAVIASLAGDGIAIALHSAQLAARIYAAGGDSSDYRRQALQSFRSPVRTAQLLTWLFSGARGRRLSFALSRLWPTLVDSAIVHTRLKRV